MSHLLGGCAKRFAQKRLSFPQERDPPIKFRVLSCYSWFLIETVSDDADDFRLLIGGHLVVGGEAEAAGEDVGADVLRAARDVGVRAGAAVAVARHEGVHAEERLHVHRLPDRAALRVGGGQFFENLRGTGPALFMDIACIGIGSYLLAHRVGIDQQAGQPEVRLHGVRQVGVHADGEVLQPFLIPKINGFLLGDVLLQIGDLAADDARDDVAHAVVVASLLVLIPRGGLAGLRGPFPRLLGGVLIIREEHAAGRARDDLVAVEGDGVELSEGACLAALVGRAEALGGILYQRRAVLFADGEDLIKLVRCAVEVREHDDLRLRMEFEGLLQGDGIHVPRLALRVDEDGRGLFVHDGIDGRRERHVGAKHFIARLDAGELDAEVQRGRPAGQRDGVSAADLLRDLFFDRVDVRPDGGHPVGLERLLHVHELRPVHRWR